jgi:hypothetical protein
MSEAGKGSKARPLSVSDQEYASRWENIFGHEDKKKDVYRLKVDIPDQEADPSVYKDISASFLEQLTANCPFRWVEKPVINGADASTQLVLQYRAILGRCGKYIWIDIPTVSLPG